MSDLLSPNTILDKLFGSGGSGSHGTMTLFWTELELDRATMTSLLFTALTFVAIIKEEFRFHNRLMQ